MDVIQNEQEELREQEELSKKPSREEVRAKVIEKHGLDEVEHETLIDSLTDEQLANYERTGKLISQKRSLRDELKKAKETPPKKESDPDEVETKARQVAREELENEYLESLELPDDLVKEIKKLAKLEGIPVRKAATDPYILHKKEKYEQEQRANEAAISRNNKTAATTTFDPDKPPKLDPSIDPNTTEGKAALAKFQQEKAKWMEQANKQ